MDSIKPFSLGTCSSRSRRIKYKFDLAIPSSSDTIFIVDSGCDQCVLSAQSFRVTHKSGIFYNLFGALHGMQSSKGLELVDACTLVTLKSGAKFILHVNQGLLDLNPLQKESLLQPYQARAHGVIVDDVCKRHKGVDGQPGTQCIYVDGHELPIHFDGLKQFLCVSFPTDADVLRYPSVVLTSPESYEPQRRRFSRRVVPSQVNLEEWRKRLGYPTFEVTKRTLESTTQFVNSVEAETREYMRDHRASRLPMLRPLRINDTCFHDVFFSSVTSIRGYTCFLVNALLHSQVDDVRLMRRESEVCDHFQDFIRQVGAPNISVTDCASSFLGKSWKALLRKYCIDDHATEPYHQNQNVSERRGGDLKTALLKVFHFTPWAPVKYWCYLLEFLSLARSFYAKQSLGWRTGRQVLRGETQDISVFRFPWFAPVFYYDPKKSFPNGKMCPGFFLGIDPNVGDGFSFIILPVKNTKDIPTKASRIKTIVRSVVRPRDLHISEEDYPRCEVTVSGLLIKDRNGKVLPGDILHEDEPEESAPSGNGDAVAPSPSPGSEESTDPLAESIDSEGNLSFSLPRSSTPVVEAVTQEPSSPVPLPVAPLQQQTDHNPFQTTSPPGPSGPHVPMVSPGDDPVIVEDVFSDDEEELASPLGNEFGETDRIAQNLNNIFDSYNTVSEDEEDSEFDFEDILGHRYVEGHLELHVLYMSGEKEFISWELVREDDPKLVAEYILDTDFKNKVQNSILQRWARKFMRSLRKTLRRLFGVDFVRHMRSSGSEEPSMAHPSHFRSATASVDAAPRVATARQARKRKKPGRNNRQMGEFKYGTEVPHTYADVVRLDTAAGNQKWHEAIAKEIAALLHHNCFEFKQAGYKPPRDFQRAHLKMVYDVKPCGKYKARFVVQGHRVDPRGLSTRATVVKGISVRTLDLIAEHFGLQVLTGDIGNAFIQAYTKEKCFVQCGPEFGDKAGLIAIIRKALYGLCTSAERFRTLFADFLRGLGFIPSRFDRDVWMRLRDEKDGYDYICTHVDDFKIVARDPQRWLDLIKGAFLVKESGPRGYYLGNDYHYRDDADLWTYSSQTYALEAIRKIESIFGPLPKRKSALPTESTKNKAANHPETDTSPLLGVEKHRHYQMLLGMIQWLVTIGRPDLTNAAASLSRFGACPREGHLDLALHVFGFLKQFPIRHIAIDPRPLNYQRKAKWQKLKIDFAMDYPDASEEIDSKLPDAYGEPLQSSIQVDADHAHDLVTRRSLTGLIAFIGSTPVLWISKRQGAIAASTYAAEFYALRVATEEAVNIRYMLRAFGIRLDGPTQVFGDNFSVITNAKDPDAELKKKHVALSFHVVREAIAAGVIEPFWLKGAYNIADIMTKQLPPQEALKHIDSIFWRSGYHIRDHNFLDAAHSQPKQARRMRSFPDGVCSATCVCKR